MHFHSRAGMLLDGPASPGHCVLAISMKRTLCLHWRAKNTPPAEAPPSSRCRPEHKPNTHPTLPYYAENPKRGQRRLHYSCFCIWPNSKNNQQQTSKSDLAILGSLHKQRRKANISRKLFVWSTPFAHLWVGCKGVSCKQLQLYIFNQSDSIINFQLPTSVSTVLQNQFIPVHL